MKLNNRLILSIIIFLSGFTALSYQLIWIKEFELFFGIHIFSISAVLTAFMSGLALGSLIFGRIADRVKRKLLLFAGIELLLVIFAVFFRPFLETWVKLYQDLTFNIEFSILNINILRFLFAFLFLIFPAILIGGTMPLFMKISIHKISTLGHRTAWLYGFNNLGAFLGLGVTGFFMIRFAGLQHSLYWIASINLLNALLIFLLSGQKSPDTIPEKQPVNRLSSDNSYSINRKLLIIVLAVFAAEGFTTLGYEIIWTRILTEFSYDKTGYLFTTILLSFIFGLSAGSFLISGRLDRQKNLPARLAFIQISIGLISVFQLVLAAIIMPMIIESREYGTSWYSTSGREYFFIFLFLTIPVLLMGMTFPIVSRIYNDNINYLGHKFGKIGFLDTVGSIFGSLVAGFIMLPLLGTRASILAIALINIIAGTVLLYLIKDISIKKKAGISGLVLFLFVLSIIFFPTDPFFKTQIGKREGDRILFYEEGISGTVSVHNFGYSRKALAINGALYAFTNYEDALSHRMLGYMPYFYHESPEDVLVIGFGMGITGSTFRQEGIRSIDIAEINPSVVKASNIYFKVQNRNILNDRRVNLIFDDGRSFLLTGKNTYDIITCDATHPRFGDNLYTREFYNICNQKLNPGGYMCNWMPFNWIKTEEYKSLLKAFLEVYDNVSLWYVNRSVCLAIGSNNGSQLDPYKLFEQFSKKDVFTDFSEIDIANPLQLMARFIADEKDIWKWCTGVRANTDNNPFVEYGTVTSMAPDRQVLEWIISSLEGQLEHDAFEGLLNKEDIRYMEILKVYRKGLISEIRNELLRLPEVPDL